MNRLGLLERLGSERRSRLVLALDKAPGGLEGACRILSSLTDCVAGVKIGLPLTLSLGVEGVREIVDRFRGDYCFIADYKLADVPHVQAQVAEWLAKTGFHAAIFHLFPMSLHGIIERCRELSLDVIGVAMMSHPGAALFEKCFNTLLTYAREAGVDGVVVGATRPSYIRAAREILGEEVVILSPGVVKQGAPAGDALRNGADYEIVGRYITGSRDPRKAALTIVEAERGVIYG